MTTVYFTKDHEYISVDGDIGTIGITDHAQQALGDVVFVELPKTGTKVARGKEAAVVESVKAASDVYAAASGEVVAVNDALEGAPGTINEDAEGRGWFFKVKIADKAELAGLMDAAAYEAFLKTLD
ncbi:MAG: glycine cleavage system protein GcvH [Hyphomicrobiales bacterium]|nr:glycine cleavage system protein GcvH [Hyphomicrobiales bacterium]